MNYGLGGIQQYLEGKKPIEKLFRNDSSTDRLFKSACFDWSAAQWLYNETVFFHGSDGLSNVYASHTQVRSFRLDSHKYPIIVA